MDRRRLTIKSKPNKQVAKPPRKNGGFFIVGSRESRNFAVLLWFLGLMNLKPLKTRQGLNHLPGIFL